MTDQAAASALFESLPPALRLAVMDAAERAVLTINGHLGSQLAQPAKAPAEAEAWRDALVMDAGWRVVRFWNSLEEAQLRAAGACMILAVFRQVIEQSQVGVDWLRQFGMLPIPTVPSPASPAPGSAA